MRKILLTVFLISCVTITVRSQNHIKVTQFFQAPQLYNPGFSGIEPFTDLKFGRKQNLGAFEFAPKTSFVSLTSSFNASEINRLESYSLRISNPKVYKELKKSSFTLVKHGVGAFYVNENQDAFTQQKLQVSYSMHFSIKDKTRLSIGVAPYLFNNRVDLDKITFETNPDPFYSKYDNISYSNFGMNAGILLYGKRFYLGYSALDFLKTKPTVKEGISGDSTLLTKNFSHRFMGAFSMNFGKRFDVLPSLLVTFSPLTPIVYNFNTKFRYEKRYWAGVSYQTSGTISIATGAVLKDWLNIGYSYDHTIAGISNYVSGSHEIVVGIMLFGNNLNKPYFW